MREIKFRSWDKNNETMEYEGYGDNSGDRSSSYYPRIELNGYVCDESHDSFVLMQFTGLIDKNGEEIFEGDILKWKDKKYIKAVVEWGEQADQARWLVVENLDVYDLSDLAHRNLVERIEAEVIGNIYENPDLVASPTL